MGNWRGQTLQTLTPPTVKNYPESKEILEMLEGAKNILLALHISPDADSVGSNLAFSRFLKTKNIEHQIFSVDPPPDFLSFLSGFENLKHKDPREEVENFDTIVFLDSAAPERVTRHEHGIPLNGKSVVVIDHHHTNSGFGDINLIDAKASSTGEILYKLLSEWKYEIPSDVATSLLCAICGDTGNFRFATTPETLSTASELVEKGASLRDIDFNLYKKVPLKMLKYQAAIINKLELVAAGNVKFAYAAMSKQEVEALGGDEFAKEGSGQLGNIEEVDFGLVIKEDEDSTVGGSFRARTDVDVSELAQLFGGGGHKAAAGFHTKIEGSFEETKKDILKKITDHLE